MFLLKILSFICIISIVVVIHEFGHYIFARLFGVKVLEFSVGFGRKIFSRTDKFGTEWQFRLLPLGGYVKMNGDEDPASLKKTNSINKDDKTALYNKNLKQRFMIVFAGPFFNYILAIILYSIVAFFYGVSFAPNTIESVLKDSPAYNIGIKPNDKIIEINSYKTENFNEVARELALSTNDEIQIKILRNFKILVFHVKPYFSKVDGKKIKIIGISGHKHERQKKSFWGSLHYGVSEIFSISRTSLIAIKQIISRDRSAKELGGPIKIAMHSAQAFAMGFVGILLFTAFLSVNLGLMNLLPIPLLDGGHLFLYSIEGIINRPLPDFCLKILLYIGIAILGSLMIFASINDIHGILIGLKIIGSSS